MSLPSDLFSNSNIFLIPISAMIKYAILKFSATHWNIRHIFAFKPKHATDLIKIYIRFGRKYKNSKTSIAKFSPRISDGLISHKPTNVKIHSLHEYKSASINPGNEDKIKPCLLKNWRTAEFRNQVWYYGL